jgi:putative flippase GtrA
MTRGKSLEALLAGSRAQAWLLFLRFGMVGLVNTGFGYAMFALLILAGAWPDAALVGATIAGVAFNFQTSRRLVFRSKGCSARFIALYIIVLVFNWAALRALRQCGLADIESQAMLAVPVAAVSFLGQKAFVFGQQTGPA